MTSQIPVSRSTSLVSLPSWRVIELCREALCGRGSGVDAHMVARDLTLAAEAAGDLGHVLVSVADLVAVSP